MEYLPSDRLVRPIMCPPMEGIMEYLPSESCPISSPTAVHMVVSDRSLIYDW